MAKDDKRTLPLRLRFPEFSGQTVPQLKLKDVTAESTIRNGEMLSTTSVMGVKKAEGIVPMEERLIASDIARYKLVEKDWFAYNPMRLNIGSIARWQGESDILVSPDYVVFKCLDEAGSGIDPAYLDHFRLSEAWEDFVKEGGGGSVRVRIYYKDLARLQLALPSLSEQQKIAGCLTSLDDVIAAQGRRVETQKAHKNGLMQQLFPREGETVPRLRFPEFCDAPEWDNLTLESICQIQRGKFTHRPRNAPEFFNGPYRFIQTGDVVRANGGAVSASQSLNELGLSVSKLFKPTIVLITIAANIGFTALLENEACFTDSVVGLIPKEDRVTARFLEAAVRLKKDHLNQVASRAAQKNINNEVLSVLTVLLPSIAEQQRIADCLSALDARIAAEADKLAALKTHKQGLMQQLFPSPEGC